MNNKWKKGLAVMMLIVFSVTGALPSVAADDVDASAIEAYREQQKALQQQIEEAKKNVNNSVIEKNKTLSDLKKLNDNIDTAEVAIGQLDTEIAAAEEQIVVTELEIDNKQRDLEGRMDILSTRLKEIYQYGDVDFLEVLLQSSDLTDFLTRFEYLRYIAENDQKLLEEVKVIKQGLEEQKASLIAQREDLETKKSAHEIRVQEWQTAGQEKQVLLDSIQDQLAFELASLDAVEAENSKVESQIRRLQSSGGTAPASLTWPCPSSKRVTSVYGPRNHPIKKKNSFHTGVDIGAASGQKIVAAADGTVIAAGYNSAYGNYMIVDHGGSMSTMYAHMSAFVAKEGDKVSANDTIGKIGSTGLSTGPHLHFEVRINGAHTSPNPYLRI